MTGNRKVDKRSGCVLYFIKSESGAERILFANFLVNAGKELKNAGEYAIL